MTFGHVEVNIIEIMLTFTWRVTCSQADRGKLFLFNQSEAGILVGDMTNNIVLSTCTFIRCDELLHALTFCRYLICCRMLCSQYNTSCCYPWHGEILHSKYGMSRRYLRCGDVVYSKYDMFCCCLRYNEIQCVVDCWI